MLQFLDNLRARITNTGYGSQNRSISLISSWLSSTLWLIESRFLNLAKETYSQNEVIYACLRLLSQSVPEAPLTPYADAEKKKALDTTHPLALLIRQPNELMTEYEFWELTTLHMAIVGRSTWWKERNNAGQVIGLWPLRPDRVGPRYSDSDEKGERVLWGYNYQVPGTGAIVPIPRRDVIAFNFPDPAGESGGIIEGIGPVMALARQVASDNEATKFVGALLANYAAPTVAVKIKGKVRNEDEANLIKSHFRSQFGGANRGIPAVIDGESEIQVIGFNLRELEFPEIREIAESRIAAALGVPAVLVGLRVGLMRSTFNNMTESRRFFSETTLSNYWRRFQDQYTLDIAAEFDESIICEFDTSKVKALAGALLELAQPIVDAFKAGAAMVNDYRAALKMELLDPEYGEVLYVPTAVTVVPVTEKAKAAIEKRQAAVPRLPEVPLLEGPKEDEADEDEEEETTAATKYNPYHGAGGRFTSGGGATSVSLRPGGYTQQQKERIATATGATAPMSGTQLAEVHEFLNGPGKGIITEKTLTHLRTERDALSMGEHSSFLPIGGRWVSPEITAKYEGRSYGGNFKSGDPIRKIDVSGTAMVYRDRGTSQYGSIDLVEISLSRDSPAWASVSAVKGNTQAFKGVDSYFQRPGTRRQDITLVGSALTLTAFYGYKAPGAAKKAAPDIIELSYEEILLGILEALGGIVRPNFTDDTGKTQDLINSDLPPDININMDEPIKSYALKDAADPREMAEKRMQKALEALFLKWGREAADKIKAGQSLSEADIEAELSRVIEPQLVEVATQEGLRIAAEIGVQFDPAIVNLRASEWAARYQFDLVKSLTDTTRKVLQNAVSKYASTPGMTIGELEALISPAFGTERANLIAQTEITRAAQAGIEIEKAELDSMGIKMERVWNSVNDMLVCPLICAPLHRKPEAEWHDRYPIGPPAHPGCRCSTTLRSVK